MKQRVRNFAIIMGLMMAGAGIAIAAGTADELITARQAEMKANVAAVKALAPMMKGDTPYSNEAVQAALKNMAAARATADGLDAWNASAQKGTAVTSNAKPEVWSDAAGFAQAFKEMDAAVATLAASTDEASFKAAFPALAASCKSCHQKYRGEN